MILTDPWAARRWACPRCVGGRASGRGVDAGGGARRAGRRGKAVGAARVVRVGDQLLSVGDEDVSHQTVSNMRHLIIGRLLLTTVIRKKDKDLEVNVIVSKGRLCPKENSAAQGW